MDKSVPIGAAKLLDFIGSIEAPQGYDTVYGNNQGKLTKPITAMTVDELLENQQGFTKAFGSSASGRYQFMRLTLSGLKSELRLRGQQVMTPDLQDRLGYHLLRRRGYDDFVAGRISIMTFALNLAKEWASFPVLTEVQGSKRSLVRGQSYYAGDGLNRALVAPERIEALLADVLAAPDTVAAGPAPIPVTPPAAPPIVPASHMEGLKKMIPMILATVLPMIIKEVMARAIRDPNVPIASTQPQIAANEVAAQVIERVQQIPEIQHATNTEPWYQSRVQVGNIVSALCTIAGVFGFAWAPENQDVLVGAVMAAGSLAGVAYSLYGRRIAKKPIGT